MDVNNQNKPTNQIKTNNRRPKRGKKKVFKQRLKLAGLNIDDFNCRKDSWDNFILQEMPSIITLQETKMKGKGKMKSNTTEMYTIYELRRKSKGGGCIAIGVLPELNPGWINQGDDEVEVLTVQINVKEFNLRITTAYAPQEKVGPTKNDNFWTFLEQEYQSSDIAEIGWICQMDSNAWLGSDVIPGDPNQKPNSNGKRFRAFLERNPAINVVNALDLCEGLITRQRTTTAGDELSILDVFLVCNRVLPYVVRMQVDDGRKFQITNFTGANHGKKVTYTDHNVEILELSIEFEPLKLERVEIFDFTNEESISNFKDITSNTNKLSNCFKNDQNSFEEKFGKWWKVLEKFQHTSFNKIRVISRKKPKEKEVHKLIEKRKELIKDQKETFSRKTETNIEALEVEIANILSETNLRIFQENFAQLGTENQKLNQNGMWKAVRNLKPKVKKTLPSGLKNLKGQIITNPEEQKSLMLEHFVKNRLRHTPPALEAEVLYATNVELFEKRRELASHMKLEPWTMTQLNKILKSLKKGKSRDPQGQINELYSLKNIGCDLKLSLLLMFNEIRNEIKFPEVMLTANITTIFKGGRKSRLDLISHRGIFTVNTLRSIFMRLLYEDIYWKIDSEMSDANSGARKNKGTRNNTLIVNSIIHDTLSSKKKPPISIQINDFRTCFDSMDLKLTMNDLYDSGVTNNEFNLMIEADKEIHVAIKTPNGLTERKTITNKILQGDVIAPLKCAVQMDFGKECEKEDKYLFSFKGKVNIPPLGYLDDEIGIAELGPKTTELNGFFNAKAAEKKLQLAEDKCVMMKIGKEKDKYPSSECYVEGWKVVENKDTTTGEYNIQDIQIGKQILKEVQQWKYLGNILSSDGSPSATIVARISKAKGACNTIMTLITHGGYGPFYFEVALQLRQSLFLSSLLSGCDSWVNLNKSHMEDLNKSDCELLKQILNTPISTPRCLVYLELGCQMPEYIVMKQVLMFLQQILKLEKTSLLYKFVMAMEDEPTTNDWLSSAKKYIEKLNINMSLNDIKEMSITKFKRIVKTQSKIICYKQLISEIKSKGKECNYKKLNLQTYFRANAQITNIQAKHLFAQRARMYFLKNNFKGAFEKYTCRLCKSTEIESNEHLLLCQKLKEDNEIISIHIKYENIFSTNLNSQINASILIRNKMNYFKQILQDNHISLLEDREIGVELGSLLLDPTDSRILISSAICTTE